MTITKYKYSLKFSLFIVIMLSVFISWLIYQVIIDPDESNRMVVFLAILPFLAFLVFACKKYFIPALQGKTALELDKDRLQYFASNKTIYWIDIEGIDKNTGGRNGWTIIFSMLDRSRDVKIPTKFIMGRDEDIFNAICECAKEARPEIWLL